MTRMGMSRAGTDAQKRGAVTQNGREKLWRI
jgi:hypothetical protein